MPGNTANTDTVWIASLLIAGVTTGIYLCTLTFCLRWLLFSDQGWQRRKRINWALLATTLVLFLLSTTHLTMAAIATVNLVQRDVRGAPPSPKLPWTSVVLCTATDVTVLIADAFLIYRCWVVCLKAKKSVFIPVFFWVGGLVCTILQAYWQIVKVREIKDVWTPVNMTVGPGTILTPFWACTIVVNLYSTGMIIYRIWKVNEAEDRNCIDGPSRDLRFVIRIFVESGFLYLIVTVPHFAVYWTNTAQSSAAILVLGWINLPVICSTFNLIIIRTAQRRAEKMVKIEKVQPNMVFEQPKVHSFSDSRADLERSSAASDSQDCRDSDVQ